LGQGWGDFLALGDGCGMMAPVSGADAAAAAWMSTAHAPPAAGHIDWSGAPAACAAVAPTVLLLGRCLVRYLPRIASLGSTSGMAGARAGVPGCCALLAACAATRQQLLGRWLAQLLGQFTDCSGQVTKRREVTHQYAEPTHITLP
jgi:hypothetical protein